MRTKINEKNHKNQEKRKAAKLSRQPGRREGEVEMERGKGKARKERGWGMLAQR